MIANSITVSRMLFSLLLLFLPLSSGFFTVLYFLCGITDVLDGFAARTLHTESDAGAKLDSTADLFFAFVYAVKILPRLQLPLWSWIWTGGIAIAKISGIYLKSKKERKLSIEHSFANKLTGLLIFLLPLSASVAGVKCAAALVCTAATFTVIREIADLRRMDDHEQV